MSLFGWPYDEANSWLTKFGVVLAQNLECSLRILLFPLLQRLCCFDSLESLHDQLVPTRVSRRPKRMYRFRRALIAFIYVLPRRHLIHCLIKRTCERGGTAVADWRRTCLECKVMDQRGKRRVRSSGRSEKERKIRRSDASARKN